MSSLIVKGSPLRRWGPWIAVFVVAVGVLSIATFGTLSAPTAQDRVSTISNSVKCPVCSGESVAASNAPASQEIRRQIAEQVQQGQTDEEIRAYYSSDTVYGPDALLTPPADGVGGLVWVLPVVAIALAAVGLTLAFRRWAASGRRDATDEDRALVAEALDAPDGGTEPGGAGRP